MDLESECSVHESVEDNEEIKNVSTLNKLENSGESKVQNNGSLVMENNGNSQLLSEMRGKETEILGSSNSHPVEINREVSPSPPRKGYGLKKWRRIRRDASIRSDSRLDIGVVLTEDRSNSAGSSKRVQVYTEKNQKSEGSASSTNAVVKRLDGYTLLGDSGVPTGLAFALGTDSENSEDQSSKSSTAASAPKERPISAGFMLDKSRMRSSSGKNLTPSVQRTPQGKGRTEPTKKARGERVKIEKENSQSSLESDSRSSNFVFIQGPYTSNGIQSERPADYDGEFCDEAQGKEHHASGGLRDVYNRNGERGFHDNSPEDGAADSSSEVKEERSGENASSSDQDPLFESVFALQSLQEALGKEVLKFKEISKDVEQELLETSSDQLTSGGVVRSSSQAVSEVIERANPGAEREVEDLFEEKIQAEVKYLAMSGMVQKLTVTASDQITILEQQKSLASQQTEILRDLEDTENKAALLEKEAKKLETICEDIANADETLKLQKRVCKYTSCFLVQIVLLAVILGVVISQVSPDYVVPT